MRKIRQFGEEYTVEEFVKKEILSNRGTQCVALKEDMALVCKKRNITLTGKETKERMYELLIDAGCTSQMLAEEFGVGVSSQVYQHEFGITHQDVKRIEKSGKIRKVGSYRFRAYGKYLYAPLYDVYQFATLTNDEIQEWI